MTIRKLFAFLLVMAFSAPAGVRAQADETDEPASATPRENDKRFHARLREIAKEYEEYRRVDADLRLAMLDCRAPSKYIGQPRISESEDTDTHGKKLYYLYAKQQQAYREVSKNKDQSRQVIVKETWQSVPIDPKELDRRRVLTAKIDDEHWVPGKRGDLFVMYREDNAGLESATDQGWVYATIAADRKTVTSAGRVSSCMECHKTAPHGRLFGVKELSPFLIEKPSKQGKGTQPK